MYFRNKLNSLLYDLRISSEKIKYKNSDPVIFNYCYRDCFETIRALTKLYKPKYIFDIGANTGHWSYIMSQMNNQLEHVVFFEPQSYFCRQIESLKMPGITKKIYQCGLGDKNETLTIKGGTASASFMEATDALTGYFPGSILDTEEKVKVKVLDDIFSEDNLPAPDLIKLDVQGFELSVLRGAVDVLSRTRYLVMELSFRKFYKGQPPLWELLQFLEQHNFIMISRGYELRTGNNNSEVLQMDGIFVNTGLVKEYGISMF